MDEEQMLELEPDYVSLTNDLLFHLVFTKNEQARRSLISSLLGIPESEIISAVVINPIQLNESLDTKTTVLDLNVHLNNEKHVLVEMQVRKFDHWTNRTLIYGCREIDDQTRGKDFSYGKLQAVIQIAIMDYTLFPGNKKFYARYKVLDEESGYPFTDKLQFYIMDLTAIEMARDTDREDGLVDWANAFSAKDWKAVEKIENAGVKEARITMETIMSTPEQRRAIWNRRKALLDYKSGIEEAEARGEIKGTIRTWYEDFRLSPAEILQKIIDKFSLEEKDAKTYVEETLGVKLGPSIPTMAENTAVYDPGKSESEA